MSEVVKTSAPAAPVHPSSPDAGAALPNASGVSRPSASGHDSANDAKNVAPSDKERVEWATTVAINTAAKGLASNAELQTLLYCCGANVIEAKQCLMGIWDNRPGQPGRVNAEGRPGVAPASDRGMVGKPAASGSGIPRPMTAHEIADTAANPNSPRYDGTARVSYAKWEIPEADIQKCLADNGFTADVFAKAIAAIARAWATV